MRPDSAGGSAPLLDAPRLRVVATNAFDQGRLFERLCRDYLMTLGYGQMRSSAHPGRQVDIIAEHLIESRYAIAECKATRAPVGGDDLNKFVGVLSAERERLAPAQVEGYFLSADGYRDSALEQERASGRHSRRFIAVDGSQIIEQLARGRIIVPLAMAVERAGRVVASHGYEALSARSTTLLVSEWGPIWAVGYSEHPDPTTHMVLLHAGDGAALGESLVERLLYTDTNLSALTVMGRVVSEEQRALAAQALEAYQTFLDRELGVITTAGITSDQYVGSQRIPIEDVFVPQTLQPETDTTRDAPEALRRSIGQALAEHRRLSVLAVPGGGKSTLLKRLATAYAFPERRTAVDDHLPDWPLLPLVIRCRELGSYADRPLRQSLEAIPETAEMTQHTAGFRLLIQGALHAGEVLLLIDGLDEISDEGARSRFVASLRIFLAAFSEVAVVVTARPAGYRLVAAAVGEICRPHELSELDPDGIRQLCLDWNRAVEGDTEAIRRDAAALAARILANNRLHRLAVNPLLLTTLLLVNRGGGTLPRKRTVLYDRALEVLLETWNTEGHDPIDMDEVVPQLAWIAFEMMCEGTQQIGQRSVVHQLREARKAMEELFGHGTMAISTGPPPFRWTRGFRRRLQLV